MELKILFPPHDTAYDGLSRQQYRKLNHLSHPKAEFWVEIIWYIERKNWGNIYQWFETFIRKIFDKFDMKKINEGVKSILKPFLIIFH